MTAKPEAAVLMGGGAMGTASWLWVTAVFA